MQKKTLVEIGLGVAALAAVLYFVRGRNAATSAPNVPSERTVASAPIASAVTPSAFPLCKDLDGVYRKMNAKLGCKTDNSAFGKALCETPLQQKPECKDELETLVGCTKNEPETGWKCDPTGRLTLQDTACAKEIAALRACMQW
jgi:hypothetical protein